MVVTPTLPEQLFTVVMTAWHMLSEQLLAACDGCYTYAA